MIHSVNGRYTLTFFIINNICQW